MLDRLFRRFRPVPPAEPQVAVLLPEPLAGQVRTLLADGRQIEAVRLIRRRTGLPLLPAVRAVDALAAEPPG